MIEAFLRRLPNRHCQRHFLLQIEGIPLIPLIEAAYHSKSEVSRVKLYFTLVFGTWIWIKHHFIIQFILKILWMIICEGLHGVTLVTCILKLSLSTCHFFLHFFFIKYQGSDELGLMFLWLCSWLLVGLLKCCHKKCHSNVVSLYCIKYD